MHAVRTSMCLCLGRGWGTKNICTGAYHHDVKLLLGMQDSLLSRMKPRFLTVDEGDTVMCLTGTDRSVEKFSFMMVDLEVMCSCASGGVCQTFQDAFCNMGGEEWPDFVWDKKGGGNWVKGTGGGTWQNVTTIQLLYQTLIFKTNITPIFINLDYFIFVIIYLYLFE